MNKKGDEGLSTIVISMVVIGITAFILLVNSVGNAATKEYIFKEEVSRAQSTFQSLPDNVQGELKIAIGKQDFCVSKNEIQLIKNVKQITEEKKTITISKKDNQIKIEGAECKNA